MTAKKMGQAVIINNVASEYPGTRVDAEALEEAFETIGFSVGVYSDCHKQVGTSLQLFGVSQSGAGSQSVVSVCQHTLEDSISKAFYSVEFLMAQVASR